MSTGTQVVSPRLHSGTNIFFCVPYSNRDLFSPIAIATSASLRTMMGHRTTLLLGLTAFLFLVSGFSDVNVSGLRAFKETERERESTQLSIP